MKISKKTLLLSTLSTLTIAGAISAVAIANFDKTATSNFSEISTRSVSNNSDRPKELTNPNQLYFSSQSLAAPTVDDLIIKSGDKYIPNDTTINKWKTISANFEKVLQGNSSVGSELKNLGDELEKTALLNCSLKELEDLPNKYPGIVTSSIVEQMKQNIISNNPDKKVDPAEIPGFSSNINELLLKLSGIAEGSKIESFQVPSTFTEVDVMSTSATASGTPISLTSIAGANYKQLVKIAEIDPNTAGNYALSFRYQDRSKNAAAVKGTLYIKNDEGQLSNASSNIESLVNNLDVFGRFDVSEINNGTLGGNNNSSKSIMENFVLQFNNNKLEVLLRVKDTDILRDVQFTTDIEGATNLQNASKFGILDVQATDSKTFKSSILGSTDLEGNAIKAKLVDNINDSSKVISSIQFFSDTLSAISNNSSVANWQNDRTMTFYQGKSEVNFNLYSAHATETEGYNRYQVIKKYQGSTPLSENVSIKITNDGQSASQFPQPNTYDLYIDLKNELPQIAQDNFEDASTITLNSYYDSNSKISKQELKFSDFFYAIGDLKSGEWGARYVTDKWEGIAILDPTQKIFLEAPNVYVEPASPSTSDFKAIEQIDETSAVKQIFGDIYTRFANNQLSDFGNKSWSWSNVEIWTSDAGNKNIRQTRTNVSGNGNAIYRQINDVWTKLDSIINTIFGGNSNPNRYKVSTTNTGKQIMDDYIASILWTYNDINSVSTIINESIEIVKNDVGTITTATNYDSISQATKQALADKVAQLIRLQFDSINKEFTLLQYNPIVDEINKAMNSTDKSNYNVINDPSSFLEIKDINGIQAIKYTADGWNNVFTTASTTFKDAISSLFNLLYFSNGNTYLGISIFDSSTSVNSARELFINNSTDLLTTNFGTNINADSIKGKITIYDAVLSFFGEKDSIQNALNDMLKNGTKLQSINIESKIKSILNKITNSKRNSDSKGGESVNSYFIDDIISGTNAYIALTWKKQQLQNQRASSQEVIDKIDNILGNIGQASSNQLSTWSNIINDNFDFDNYSQQLAGRVSDAEFERIINALINEDNIMKNRDEIDAAAIQRLEDILKYLWWIIIALVGVGILVSSTVGLATKNRQVKLSSRPVLKWLLISGIIIGAAAAALAIVFGIVL